MKEYFARFKYLYITLVVILVVTIAATAVYDKAEGCCGK